MPLARLPQVWYNVAMTININVSQLPRWKKRVVIAVSLPFVLIAQTALVFPALIECYGQVFASAIQKWNQ
jgi:hypothetical protein